MNPTELLSLADRLAASCVARVRIISSGAIATLHPPGRDASNRKLLLNAGTDAHPRILAVPPEDARLLPVPDPDPPKITPRCVLCGESATLHCTGCKASICGMACAKANWKVHKAACRGEEARLFGGCWGAVLEDGGSVGGREPVGHAPAGISDGGASAVANKGGSPS